MLKERFDSNSYKTQIVLKGTMNFDPKFKTKILLIFIFQANAILKVVSKKNGTLAKVNFFFQFLGV